MEREKSEQMAIAILRQIVDALAEERFGDIARLAELEVRPPERLRDIIVDQLRTYPHFDHWTEERERKGQERYRNEEKIIWMTSFQKCFPGSGKPAKS